LKATWSSVPDTRALTLIVATAINGDIPIQLSALGTVTPVATINVNARVSGTLDQVAFKEGQMVRKGQLLAVIDPRPYKISLDQARAQLQRDQALLATAQADLGRYKTLHSQDSIAGQTYDTQVDLVRQDAATVAADRASVANAALNLSFTHIISPVAGRVGLRQVDPGNQIVANATTPVAIVTQINPITVVFALPEAQISQIVRQNGGAGLAVTALDRAGGAPVAQGRLLTLDNEIDAATGTVKAKAQFDNGAGALFPNQFVNISLLADTLHNQVMVPTAAVRHGPNGDYVWVVQPGKTVKSRPVVVGPGTPETVSIQSGLRGGESVITDGGDKLKDGAKVTLPKAGGETGGSDGPSPGAARQWHGGGGAAAGASPGGGRHHHEAGAGASASASSGQP